MPRNSFYYYDHETCAFVEVQPDSRRRLRRAGAVAAVLAVLATSGFWWSARPVTTPTELAQREEINALRGQLTSANRQLSTFSHRLDDLAATDRELYRTVLNADPISEDEFQMGVGGAADSRFDRFSAPTAQLMRQTSATLDRLDRQFELQARSFDDLKALAREREHILREQPAILPVRGARLTSGFGMRFHPILHTTRLHAGVDFPVPVGTPIYATGDGEVAFTGVKGGYGQVVELRHPEAGRLTRYAHLSRLAEGVRPGAAVRRGQVIAYSGNSGLSTAPHLHYEVRRLDNDQPLNPVTTFVPGVSPREYQQLVAAAQQETISFD